MSLGHGASIVRNGLILYLDAANRKSYPGSGSTWFDLSGNGNSGTLVNGPTFNGLNNGSIVFDGSNDYSSLSDTVLATTTSPFTVYLWMKHNPRTSGQLFHRMLTLKSSVTEPLGIAYLNGTSNGYSGLYLTSASGWTRGSTAYFPTANVWGMLTVTYNGLGSTTGTNFKMYWNAIDINYVQNDSTTTVSVPNGSFIATRRSTADDQIYRGEMSVVSVYNTLHGEKEIQQNFNALRGRYGI